MSIEKIQALEEQLFKLGTELRELQADYLGEEVTPQFNYWQRPEKLDDGGENVPG
jgi:hypothetical protein